MKDGGYWGSGPWNRQVPTTQFLQLTKAIRGLRLVSGKNPDTQDQDPDT